MVKRRKFLKTLIAFGGVTSAGLIGESVAAHLTQPSSKSHTPRDSVSDGGWLARSTVEKGSRLSGGWLMDSQIGEFGC